MCDEQFPRRIAFGFLEDIKNRFLAVYKTSFKDALPFAMNEEFSRVLQRQMVRVFFSKFVSHSLHCLLLPILCWHQANMSLNSLLL